MQYLLLIYNSEKEWAAQTEEQKGKVFGEYMEFTKDIVKSGHFKGGEALEPSKAARTVRVRGGKTLTTDGPFAETREQLGGYYLVEAKNVEEAIGIAARIPDVRGGSVEVRPVMPMPSAG